LGDQALRVRGELGKAYGRRVGAEDAVDVLEERVSDDPCGSDAVRSARGEREDGSETLAVRELLQFHVVRGDGPRLAAEGERDVDGRRAGYGETVWVNKRLTGECVTTYGTHNTPRDCQYLRKNRV